MADSRQRRIWFQIHVVDSENVVVALVAEFEWVVTRHFVVFIKNLLVATEERKGVGRGESRKREQQESESELHSFRGMSIGAW